MHPLVRYAGGAGVRWSVRRTASRFERQFEHCATRQAEVLADLLRLNGGSDCARQLGLVPGMSLAEFRKTVPLTDFETYRPFVERMKRGDLAALLGPSNRLLMYTLSSGTTSESKFVPITARFLDDYRRGWKVWGIRAFDAHPGIHMGEIVQLSSDYDQFRTEAGHPCGNISGLVSAMQSPFVKTMYAVPDCVAKIKSPDAKYYTALRLAVANRRIALLMTANPSTVVHLAHRAAEWSDRLIRDVQEGTLSRDFDIPDDIRRQLWWRISKDRARAAELRTAAERAGALPLGGIWPGLSLISCWTGGSAAAYLPGVRKAMGAIPIRDHGLSASEGRMTIPFADESSTGVLDIGTHFFEFIPESDIDREHPEMLLAHELSPGCDYYILLTTASGFYRYNIRDVVRCHGFRGTTPLLEFLHKGAHMANLTGEKLAESQVVKAVSAVLSRRDLHPRYFTLCPVFADPPGYRLLVESTEVPEPQQAAIAAEIDTELRAANSEYDEKRRTDRLLPVSIDPLPGGTWQRFASARQARLGGSIEQYKHPCLVGDIEFYHRFRAEHLGDLTAARRSADLLDFDEVVEEGRPAAEVGESRRGRRVHVDSVGGVLRPPDAG